MRHELSHLSAAANTVEGSMLINDSEKQIFTQKQKQHKKKEKFPKTQK